MLVSSKGARVAATPIVDVWSTSGHNPAMLYADSVCTVTPPLLPRHRLTVGTLTVAEVRHLGKPVSVLAPCTKADAAVAAILHVTQVCKKLHREQSQGGENPMSN